MNSQSTQVSETRPGTVDAFGTSTSQKGSCGLHRYRPAARKQRQDLWTRGTTAPSHKHDGDMFRHTIAWERNEDTPCWADAETASAVLSLLNKEPVHLTQGDTTKPDRDSQIQYSTCAVCFERLHDRSLAQSPIAAYCDHTSIPETHICTSCLQRSLEIQLSSAGPNTLFCPLCHAPFSDTEVQRWAARETFESYNSIRTRAALEHDTEFITCARRNCGFGQLHAGGRGEPVVICGACGTKTCFIHRDTIWHEGLSCEEYDEIMDFRTHQPLGTGSDGRREGNGFLQRLRGKYRRAESRDGHIGITTEELLSRRMMDKVTKPCHRCTAPTERTGGCKYMRCKSITSIFRLQLLTKA